MAIEERQKVLLYVLVVPDEGGGHDESKGGKGKGIVNPNPKLEQASSFRYTRSVLQSTLQLMGCKSRHAFKISRRVFDMLASESSCPVTEKLASSLHDFSRHLSDSEIDNNRDYTVEDIKQTAEENGIIMDKIEKALMLVQRKRSTVVISRSKFLDVICEALSEYRYFGPNQRADLSLACRIRERKTSMTILLCGTSGCGKSTLSTLLASRLGITTVVSTDSIRHMMRSFVDERDNPLLWASTYHAGEHLDPVAVAESKAKKKARKMSSHSPLGSRINLVQANTPSPNVVPKNSDLGKRSEEASNDRTGQLLRKGKASVSSEANINGIIHDGAEIVVSEKMLAIQGYKAQSEMVIDSLDRLITSWEQKCESVIVEGVHLSLNFVMGLMKKHPSIIPFLVFIENEEKHIERFAVRAKYMALDPSRNKYVKYIRNIRAIQDYLCKRADKHLVPKVNNTNVDRSIIAIHATIFSCIRRRNAGEQLYDPPTNTMKVLDEEYRNQCNANSFGSRVMLQVIRRRGSSRQLVALVNDDGSVARTWPFEASDKKEALNGGSFDGLDTLMSVGNAQTVNLQFGNFGLSAFTSDLEGTSHTSSIDGFNSRGNGAETDSSHLTSSCSSSPRVNGSDKELVSENAVSESEEEEEAEDGADLDTDNEQLEEDGQLEGSVDEESIRSDEDEMMDGQEDAYWTAGIGNQSNKEARGLEKSLVSDKKGLEGNGRMGIGLCSNFSKRPSGHSLHIATGGSTSAKFNPNEDSCNVKNSLMARAEKGSHNRSKSLPFLETHDVADSSSTVVIENSKV